MAIKHICMCRPHPRASPLHGQLRYGTLGKVILTWGIHHTWQPTAFSCGDFHHPITIRDNSALEKSHHPHHTALRSTWMVCEYCEVDMPHRGERRVSQGSPDSGLTGCCVQKCAAAEKYVVPFYIRVTYLCLEPNQIIYSGEMLTTNMLITSIFLRIVVHAHPCVYRRWNAGELINVWFSLE